MGPGIRVVVGISGASGMVYALALLKALKEKGVETHLTISKPAELIIRSELGLTKEDFHKYASECYDIDDLTAPIASGSQKFDGVVIIPCSMASVAAISKGLCNNLLLRVADVSLKEKRKLIVVPRETPLSPVHLENMLKLARLGVHVLPACPAFYHKPKEISDLVDFIVGRVLDILGIEHNLYKRWGQEVGS